MGVFENGVCHGMPQNRIVEKGQLKMTNQYLPMLGMAGWESPGEFSITMFDYRGATKMLHLGVRTVNEFGN